MKESKRVFKNITFGILAQIIGAGLILLTTAVIARYLGASDFGKYSFVLAFVMVFQLIADFGISQILVKNIATDKGNADKHIGIAKSFLWILSLITFILIALSINLKGSSPEILYSVYIAGLAAMAMIHVLGYNSIFQAFEEMEFNAIGFVLHKIVFLVLAYIGINMNTGILGIFVASLSANLFLWFFYYSVTVKRYGRPKLYIDPKAWWIMCKDAVPLGISKVLRMITWQIDILILAALSGDVAAGLFSGAYRLISAINTIPALFAVPLFPVFSRLSRTSHETLISMYEKSIKLLCVFSLPIAVVVTVTADRIINLLLGPSFSSSVIALQILIWAVLFLFPTTLYIYLFTAIGKQHLYTICSGICLGINILIDLLLIPSYSYIGACIGTLVAEVTLFGLGYYFLKRVGITVSFSKFIFKPIFSGIAMGFFIFQFKDFSFLLFGAGILSGMLIYIAFLFLMRTFSQDDIRLMKESLQFIKNPFLSKREKELIKKP